MSQHRRARRHVAWFGRLMHASPFQQAQECVSARCRQRRSTTTDSTKPCRRWVSRVRHVLFQFSGLDILSGASEPPDHHFLPQMHAARRLRVSRHELMLVCVACKTNSRGIIHSGKPERQARVCTGKHHIFGIEPDGPDNIIVTCAGVIRGNTAMPPGYLAEWPPRHRH